MSLLLDKATHMLPTFSGAAVDRIASVGSYYIAASSFLLAIGALAATEIALFISSKQGHDLRKLEIEQKRFENILEFFSDNKRRQRLVLSERSAISSPLDHFH